MKKNFALFDKFYFSRVSTQFQAAGVSGFYIKLYRFIYLAIRILNSSRSVTKTNFYNYKIQDDSSN